MPFTPTHIAAVLPIALIFPRRLPFSALVIGCQIPDLPLYVPRLLPFHDRVLHTVEGWWAGCLPLGLLGFLWFQGVAKVPLFSILPTSWRRRLSHLREPLLQPRYDFFAGVLLAVAVGAATHLLWDSFTHFNNWGYRLVPGMNTVVVALGPVRWELYKTLQYGSSLLFLPLLIGVLLGWLQRQPLGPEVPQTLAPRQVLFWRIALLATPPLAALLWSLPSLQRPPASWRYVAVQFVTTLGMVQFLAVNAFAACYRYVAVRSQQTG